MSIHVSVYMIVRSFLRHAQRHVIEDVHSHGFAHVHPHTRPRTYVHTHVCTHVRAPIFPHALQITSLTATKKGGGPHPSSMSQRTCPKRMPRHPGDRPPPSSSADEASRMRAFRRATSAGPKYARMSGRLLVSASSSCAATAASYRLHSAATSAREDCVRARARVPCAHMRCVRVPSGWPE